jgi:hypothetical protein
MCNLEAYLNSREESKVDIFGGYIRGQISEQCPAPQANKPTTLKRLYLSPSSDGVEKWENLLR